MTMYQIEIRRFRYGRLLAHEIASVGSTSTTGFPRVDILQIAGVICVDFRFRGPYFPQWKRDRPWSVHHLKCSKTDSEAAQFGRPVTEVQTKNKLSPVSKLTEGSWLG